MNLTVDEQEFPSNLKFRPSKIPLEPRVTRGRLIDRINESLQKQLILLLAAGGYGKTYLLQDWFAEKKECLHISWLNLDQQDDNPSRFFALLLSSIRQVIPKFDALVSGNIAGDHERLEQLADQFLAACEMLDEDLYIVIEDFHYIENHQINNFFSIVLKYQPTRLHWIVSTRAKPNFDVISSQINDQIALIDNQDLALTPEETIELSKQSQGHPISIAEAEDIRTKSEGWIAATKIAIRNLSQPDSITRLK